MKKLKKMISLLTAAVLTLSVAACGGGTGSESASPDAGSAGKEETQAADSADRNNWVYSAEQLAIEDETGELGDLSIDNLYYKDGRFYATGFYFGEPGQYYPDSMYTSAADVVAVVEHCGEDGSAVLTQRNKFTRGDTLELLLPDREPLRFRAEELRDMDGEELADTRRAMMEFRMRLPAAAPAYAIVRKRR